VAGRPKKLKIDAVRYVAHGDGDSRTFSSRSKAFAYIASAKRNVRVEAVYFVARGWELDMQRYPLAGEEKRAETDFSGKRFFERQFVLKGADRDALLMAAERRRRDSFIEHRFMLSDRRLRDQLAPASRKLAEEVLEDYYVSERDPEIEKETARKEAAEAEAERLAREARIPTVWQVFEDDLANRLKQGLIQSNTADTCRYEASALRHEVPHGREMVPLKDLRVSQVTEESVRNWYDRYSTTETRFGKLPSSKTLENTLNHLGAVRKALKSNPTLRDFAQRFEVVDELLVVARRVSHDTDGWRRRHRLSNAEVQRVLGACSTEMELAVVALALGGGRPPSELIAATWDHLEYDDAGHLWWHVSASGIERGGEVELRSQTKTKDVDYRQLSICRAHVPHVEALRGRSPFVLGDAAGEPMLPSEFSELVEALLTRAGVKRPGISTYSFRHTVGDEVERLLGRTARDLVLHGKRDRKTGGLHYSHAERDRRREELTFGGKPFGEHMPWASACP